MLRKGRAKLKAGHLTLRSHAQTARFHNSLRKGVVVLLRSRRELVAYGAAPQHLDRFDAHDASKVGAAPAAPRDQHGWPGSTARLGDGYAKWSPPTYSQWSWPVPLQSAAE